MSADNGVYILPLIRNIRDGVTNAWRVTYAMAIDNITYEPDREDGYNSHQLQAYFGNAPEFNSEEKAILHAHEIAKEYTVLEYGVSFLKVTDYQFLTPEKLPIYTFDGGVDEGTLWLVNADGDHIAKVERTPEHLEKFAHSVWQEIVDTIVAAPELLELAREQDEALRDIINCAGNDQAYAAGELADNFIPLVDKFQKIRERFMSLR